MFDVAGDVECAFLGEFGMAFYVKTSFLRAGRGVGQGVYGAANDFDFDAFAVEYAYRRSAVNRCGVG